MRLALLGDIHGNASALEAVLAAARNNGVDALCITGDFVGYYLQPVRVLELLTGWQYWAVRGNHEDMLFQVDANPDFKQQCREKYGCGLERALETLDASSLNTLKELPVSQTLQLDNRSLTLAHGAPWDTDAYVYPDAPADLWEQVAKEQPDCVVLGHTHYQHAHRVGQTLVINPGSVGQPRDKKPGAAWSLIDLETMKYEHRREHYDMSLTIDQAKRYNPEIPYLWTVLNRK